MKKGKGTQRRKGVNMQAVLLLNEYKHNTSSRKRNIRKNVCITKHNKHQYNESTMKKIVNLEERDSSADEFPLLWDEEV